MKEPILVGTHGWEDPAWSGSFYPEELPPEWRFAYYSNQLRAVAVPAERWAGTTEAEAREWPEDSDPAFRFVLELPPGLVPPAPRAGADEAWARFRALLGPLHPQVAGFLIRLAADAPLEAASLEELLARLRELGGPVCVDLSSAQRSAAVLAALERQDAGLCWQSEREPAPRPGGRLLVALSRAAEPRAQRRLLEQLAEWQGERGATAALFFEGPKAPQQAQQARLLAELLMV